MALRPFAPGLLALALAACGGANLERPGTRGAAPTRGLEGSAPAGASPAGIVVDRVARSVWGVAPDAPRRRRDDRPGLVRGSAVAVGPDTLLASCRVVGRRGQVAVVRGGDHRPATVTRPRGGQDVCALRVRGGRLEAARGFRSLGDLREGEAVYAVVSRGGGAEYAVAEGQLAAKGAGDARFLETTVVLPPDVLSAALFDAAGNLVGLGSAGPVEDSLVLAAPLSARLAPRLARLDLGPPDVRVAALPIREPRRRLLVFRDEQDRGSGDAGPALLRLVAVEPAVSPLSAGAASGPSVGGPAETDAADDRPPADRPARGATAARDDPPGRDPGASPGGDRDGSSGRGGPRGGEDDGRGGDGDRGGRGGGRAGGGPGEGGAGGSGRGDGGGGGRGGGGDRGGDGGRGGGDDDDGGGGDDDGGDDDD